jgi:hypothetical protein
MWPRKLVMKKTLILAIAVMFILHAWVSAERHTGTLSMSIVTSFDFSRYPACGLSRNSYCIHAVRFYDSDSKTRLAEVPVSAAMNGIQPIVATIRVHSIPRHAYAVTVYLDNSGSLQEGFPGQVSTFDDSGH